jgi:hypothetical protein
MKIKPPPCSQAELQRLFHYDRDSGWLIYKMSSHGVHKGAYAGRGKTNRRSVMINGKEYWTARLIFFLETGLWPPIVDHKDGDVRNENWENLRAASHSQNNANCGPRNKRSGLKGVYPLPSGKWRAQIGLTHLGCFMTKVEAAAAYDSAALKQYGEFARTNGYQG